MSIIVIPGSVKFFPTKEFKSGEIIKIKEYVGYVESNFEHSKETIAKNHDLAGKKKKVNRFNVEYKGSEYQLDMNGASLKLLAATLGKDSAEWVGKDAMGETLRMPNGGTMIEFKPVVWKD